MKDKTLNWSKRFDLKYLPLLTPDKNKYVRGKYMFPSGAFARNVKQFIHQELSALLDECIREEISCVDCESLNPCNCYGWNAKRAELIKLKEKYEM